MKIFESKKIEKSTTETINYKLEWLMIAFLSLVFTILCRVSQYSEIKRVFVIKTDAGAFRFQALMIASFLVLWIFFGFVLWIVFELGRWKHESCVRFIKFFLLYFSIQCVVLFLVWPGIFKQDELYLLFFTISDIRVVWVQSLITQIFYWLAIAMFPYVASLTFFQIIIISILAAITLKTVWANIKHKKLTYLLMISFLLLPVLDNNQFNMRNSQIAWFYMLLFMSIYYEYKKNHTITIKKACLFLLMATLIGVWKTEFLYLIPCLVMLFLIINYKRDKWKSLVYIPYIVVLYMLFTLPNRLWQPTGSYALTAVMTPLSDIITSHQGNYDPDIEKDLDIIDSWIPIEEIIDTTSYYGTPMVYFEKGNVDNTEQLWKLLSASIDIFAHYPKDFLINRFEVYKGTNGMVPDIVNQGDVSYWKKQMDIDGTDFYNYYFRFTDLGHSELRSSVITFLACRKQGSYVNTTAVMYPLFYNSTWSLLILSVIVIVSLIRKRWFNAMVYVIAILQVPLIALLAPAPMFMYYMPFYLTSYVLIFNELIQFLDGRKKDR